MEGGSRDSVELKGSSCLGNGQYDSGESGVVESVATDPNENARKADAVKEDDDQNDEDCGGCGPMPNEEIVEGGSASADSGQEDSSPFAVEFGGPNNQIDIAPAIPSRANVKTTRGFDAVVCQMRRRKETLQWQRERRDEVLDKIRQLEDSAYSDSETEDEMDFVQAVRQQSPTATRQNLDEIHENVEVEAMDAAASQSNTRSKHKNRSKKKQKRRLHGGYRSAPVRVMLSEWLLDKPEDFEENWLGVICPSGKRCIVLASRGKTKIFSRSDVYLGAYKSLLPGGCRYNYRDSNCNRNRGVTILDCIWSQQTQTFYVLDMICWNSHSCVNCDTEYRQFFIHSKFSENLELLERSAMNPFPFLPLPYFPASETSLSLASSLKFPENVDGVLFFHKEAFYIPETNPLCLWILLTQVESILNVWVAPEVLERQVKVKNLSSRKKQIEKRNQEMDMH